LAEITWHNEKRAIRDLIPYEVNPRQITNKQAKDLKASLAKFGIADPIIINTDNMIIGGHQRKKILETLLGYDPDYQIDVRVPDRELSIDEARELNVRLNKNVADWDFDILANNFELDDLLNWGFDKQELDLDLWAGEPPEDVEPQIDKAEELREKFGVETGQLWKLGDHRLICGDCTDKAVVDKVMGGEFAKTVFTSPPYNMNSNLYKDYSDNLKSEKYIEFNLEVVNNIKPHLRGYLFWNLSYNKNSRWEFLEIFYRIIKQSGLRFLEMIVWDKGHGLPITSSEMLTRSYEDILLMADEDSIVKELDLVGLFGTEKRAYFNKKTMKGITNYWRVGTNKSQIDELLACFPIELPERGIILTTNSGDIVLEPFLGSGTTLIACERLGRKCRAVEISPAYCAVAIQRWVDVTGGVPELIANDS